MAPGWRASAADLSADGKDSTPIGVCQSSGRAPTAVEVGPGRGRNRTSVTRGLGRRSDASGPDPARPAGTTTSRTTPSKKPRSRIPPTSTGTLGRRGRLRAVRASAATWPARGLRRIEPHGQANRVPPVALDPHHTPRAQRLQQPDAQAISELTVEIPDERFHRHTFDPRREEGAYRRLDVHARRRRVGSAAQLLPAGQATVGWAPRSRKRDFGELLRFGLGI